MSRRRRLSFLSSPQTVRSLRGRELSRRTGISAEYGSTKAEKCTPASSRPGGAGLAPNGQSNPEESSLSINEIDPGLLAVCQDPLHQGRSTDQGTGLYAVCPPAG